MRVKEEELFIIRRAWDEGLGALYERVMLGRLLKRIIREYAVSSVLEYGCKITKGYDNLAFLNQARVTLADEDISLVKSGWPFKERPRFASLKSLRGQFDLVWNFALVQQKPALFEKKKRETKKYLLVFTPNLFNFGSPIHACLHWLTKTDCFHPEKGQRSLRTPWGLEKFFLAHNTKVIKAGLIDIPPWPDPAFSLNELKKRLRIKIGFGREKFSQDPKDLLEKIEKVAFLEKSRLPYLAKLFFAHHIFVLGEVKK